MKILLTRSLAALALLCALSSPAWAIDVTIAGESFAGYNYAGSTAKLRIYPSQTFTASDSTTVPGGTQPGSATGFFTTVNCTVASNTLACPPVTLKSTTDALTGRDTTYAVVLFDANGTRRDFFPLSSFWLSHTNGASTTWAVVAYYNEAATRPPAEGSYTTGQTDAAIQAQLNVGNPATPAALGRLKVSATPTDPASPIAVGDNDPRVPTQAENDALAGTSGSPSSTNRYVTASDSRLAVVTPKQYGALGDGTGATITSADVTAHGAGTQYPWAGTYIAGTDTKDYVGLQEAIYAAFYNGTLTPNAANTRLNKPLHLSGHYKVNKAPTIIQLKSGRIYGDGKLSTIIETTADVAALNFNGLWYTEVSGLYLKAGAARTYAVLEIDGNYDGSNTQGVQGNYLHDLFIDANNNAPYASALCRQGGGSGQCSENVFENVHWQGSTNIGFYGRGSNQLQNTIIGGNFQGYYTGIFLDGGSINIYSTGFQSTKQYAQIANSGYDIDASSFTAGDSVIVDGCRTESLRFYKGGAQRPIIRGLAHVPALTSRTNSTALALDTVTSGVTAAGNKKLYRVTTAGTTGGSTPIWPESGTVADGSVTWTETDFDVITNINGEVSNSTIQLGQVSATEAGRLLFNQFTRTDPIASGHFINSGARHPLFFGNYAVNQNTNALAPVTLGAHTSASGQLSNNTLYDLSDGALVFTGGNGGGTYWDVGIYRGQGEYNNRARNTLKVFGGLELDTFTFAELVTGVNNATILYCSDCAPSSNPATGAGTGAVVVRQNGAWRAL